MCDTIVPTTKWREREWSLSKLTRPQRFPPRGGYGEAPPPPRSRSTTFLVVRLLHRETAKWQRKHSRRPLLSCKLLHALAIRNQLESRGTSHGLDSSLQPTCSFSSNKPSVFFFVEEQINSPNRDPSWYNHTMDYECFVPSNSGALRD